MPAPDIVLHLVDTFRTHRADYRSGHYKETQLRREFLDPLFKALGWDIDNEHGLAPAYKDVVHEDSIKIGGATKAPDYCFRIGGTRKFFLEAKEPSISIKEDRDPSYQLRRYAWSAKLPLSILSDFEEFAVYDCRIRPKPGDRASTARTLYLTYDQYPERWAEIADIFARESVLRGSFDRYAEGAKKKRGTAEVDDAFLEEIEHWREQLARNFALRNPELTVRDLNYCVQATIDRIVFLRICEDRGTEDYGRLLALLNGTNTYSRLLEIFCRADDRYNSGLFHFSNEKGRSGVPDTLTPALRLDDKVLKEIIGHLYYPESPYEFSVLPADILGQVYEQFLGKTIRLTPGHQAKIEEKPEVRKAGGVYYTPRYIVDFIVKKTLGRLLYGADVRKPNPPPVSQVDRLKVLDPACGSGTFLIIAYQLLLDWYRDQYTLDPETREFDEAKTRRHTSGRAPKIYQSRGGEWRLTTAERKRILLNNIHGVDVDSQAVEVTKLSLLLKVLEGETQQQVQRDFVLERERILPDLGHNVCCGNSLIGSDFYGQVGLPEMDDDTRYRVNVFDWNSAFPHVFKQGGFNCVVGNPPYVLLQGEFRDDVQLAYLRRTYNSASFKLDTYHVFIEKALKLLAPRGRAALITPSNYLSNNHLEALRRQLLEQSHLESITIFDYRVFPRVSVDTAIFVAEKSAPDTSDSIAICRVGKPSQLDEECRSIVSRRAVLARPGTLLLGEATGRSSELIQKVRAQGTPLGEIASVNFGKQLRDRKLFTSDVISCRDRRAVPASHAACLTGADIKRYSVIWSGLACLRSDEARSGGCWDAEVHEASGKLLCRQIGKRPFFGIDQEGFHCLNTAFMVLLRGASISNAYLLGILNSALIGFFWEDQFYDQRKTFPKIKGTYLKQLPIRPIDFAVPAEADRHALMVQLVERILVLHQRRATERNPETVRRLEVDIGVTDRQIDRLVYELYRVTEEEIALIESVER